MYLHGTKRPPPPTSMSPMIPIVPTPPKSSSRAVTPQLLPSFVIVGTQNNKPTWWTGGQWTALGASYAKCFATLADAQREFASVTYGGAYKYLNPGIVKTTCKRNPT